MPVKIATRRVATLTQDDASSFNLSSVPTFSDDVIVKKLSSGKTLVGYLVDDQDVPHPLDESDGMGRIYRWDRDSRRESKQQGFQALGLDQYGEPDPDLKRNEFAIPLDKYEHGQVIWSVAGSHSTEHWDTSRGAGVWVLDDSCLEHIKSTAIKGLLPEGTVVSYVSKRNPDGTAIMRPCKPGERSHFLNPDGSRRNEVADERYLNVITVTYPDGTSKGGYKNFVTAYLAAARKLGIKITKESMAEGAQKVAAECAAQACRVYTDWCNGNCYGYIIDVFDAAGELVEDAGDRCFGYIGMEDGESSLNDAMEGLSRRLTKGEVSGATYSP